MDLHSKAESNLFSRKSIDVLCVSIIAVVVLISFFPSLTAGLFHDDWWFLEKAGRLSLPEYLRYYLDPQAQTVWYRPVQALLFLIEYHLFKANGVAYHFRQILIHLLNSVLLYAILRSLGQNWRVALVAGLVFAGLPASSLAINWVGVPDPLAVLFYLASIWMWSVYLHTQRRFPFILTLIAFGLALLSKELSVTLIAVLFLIELLVIGTPFQIGALIRRYLPFVIVLAPYLALERYIQTNGWYVYGAGYTFGINVLENLKLYLGVVAFPWAVDQLSNLLALTIGIIFFVYFVIWKRNRRVAFLGSVAVLNVLPAVGFPRWFFEPRYAYLSLAVSAVVVALLVESARTRLRQKNWASILVAGIVVLALLANGLGTAEASAAFAEQARQTRVPFRDLSLRHPTFPEDTYLYFIVPPAALLIADISSMSFLRYGPSVIVDSPNSQQPARFQDHRTSYLYYFDETGRLTEILVEPHVETRASLEFPISFAEPLRLEGYTATRATVRRGEALVVLLYWTAQGKIAKDYTVFAHLVDEQGTIVSGSDSQPWQGHSPTSSWQPGQFIVDAITLPIDTSAPASRQYHLEVGLYYLPTMERVGILDATNQVVTDAIVIGFFAVEQ